MTLTLTLPLTLTLTLPDTNPNQVVVNHETLPALYMDELRAMAAHFGVDPDA